MIYFYVDYEEYDPGALPADSLYFHAHFRRQCPTDGWKDKFTPNHGDPVDSTPNLDGKGNYVAARDDRARPLYRLQRLYP